MKTSKTRSSWTAALAALGATVVMLPAQAEQGAQSQPQSSMTSSQQGQDAQGSGALHGNQPSTSTHQPEQGQAPGGQSTSGQDAAGSMQQSDSSQNQVPTSDYNAELQTGNQQGSDAAGTQSSRDMHGKGMQGSGAAHSQQPLTSTHQPEQSQAPGQQASGKDAAAMHSSKASSGMTREEVRAETEAWREAGLLDMMMGSSDTDGGAWLHPEVQQARDQVSAEVHAESMQQGSTRDAAGSQDASGSMGGQWQQQHAPSDKGGR